MACRNKRARGPLGLSIGFRSGICMFGNPWRLYNTPRSTCGSKSIIKKLLAGATGGPEASAPAFSRGNQSKVRKVSARQVEQIMWNPDKWQICKIDNVNARWVIEREVSKDSERQVSTWEVDKIIKSQVIEAGNVTAR